MGRLLKQAVDEPVNAPDFNPGFTFDFSADEQPQAAWEFSGALKQAREQQFAGATTIDEKIEKRLKEKGRRKQAKAEQKQRRKKAVLESDDEDSGDDDAHADEDEDDDSEDAPLPGELDEEDDSEDDGMLEVEEEDDEEDGGADDGEETDEGRLLDDEAIDEDAPKSGDDSEEEDVSEEEDESDEEFINDGAISQEEESDEEEEYDFTNGKAGKKVANEKAKNKTANGQVEKKKGKKEEAKAKTAKEAERAGKKKTVKEPINKHDSDEEDEDDDSDDDMEEGSMDEELENDGEGSQSDEDDVDEDDEEELSEEEGDDEEEEGNKAHARKRQKGQNGQAVAADAKVKKGKDSFFADKQGRASSGKTFEELNLSRPLLKAITSLGYKEPTPIQAACVPLALAGRDICGSAVTGSGKTAAYALPILERLLFRSRRVQATYVVILAPTRELAVQVHSMIEKLAQFTDISAALAVGGLSVQAQAASLKKCPEIVVATPGRLIDHVRNTQSVGLEDLAVLVLDEADRLLEMGFKDEIHEIIKLAPKKRQTMLFSATFSAEVSKLVSLSLKQPVRLAVDPSFMAPEKLCQEVVRLKGAQATMKEATLLALCSRNFHQGRTIIFTKTKQRAHRLKILFGLLKLPAAGELHGDMTQAARLESLEKFRVGELAFLLATDVAARGLDIVGVETVINYDAPRTLATHMHRIGRTARAGATGRAITLAEDADRKLLKEVVSKTKADMKARVVAAQAISLWQGKIEGAAQDVVRIIQEEREEREMRKAEMQVTKAQNMLDHEEEIMARPARTWFQTQKEKKELAKKALMAQEEGSDDEDDHEDGKGRKGEKNSKKDKAARKRDRKAAKAAEEAETKKRNRNKLRTETEEHSKKIKSIKAKTRELVQQGVPTSKAAKIASTAVTGISRKKQKKKKTTGADDTANGDLFSGDGITKAMKDAFKPTMSTQDRNRLKRAGKSKAAFKSKKKFKRRK